MRNDMIFAVGSRNPVKIGCVAEAVRAFWPDATAVGADTESGVSVQPMDDRETLAGAVNRARQALEQVEPADFGVGVEGGVHEDEDGLWAYAWVVIVDRQGVTGKGQSGRFLLPEKVARLVRQGIELGHADDQVFGRSNSKQKEGAIGILSDGHITRGDLYRPAVTFALLRFLHPEIYQA